MLRTGGKSARNLLAQRALSARRKPVAEWIQPMVGAAHNHKVGSQVIEEFRQRLAAAYDLWSARNGTTPAHFFELMDEAIQFQSVLAHEFPRDPLSGPFDGRAAVIGYWSAFAESWEMLSAKTEDIVSNGDRVVWIGRIRWRHRRSLRELVSSKIDVWTVWQGRAIRYFEMFDTAAYARVSGASGDSGGAGHPTPPGSDVKP